MAEKVTIIYTVVDDATTKLGRIAGSVKGIGASSTTAGKAVSGLGPIAKTAAGLISAYMGVRAVRAVTDFAKESVQAFADFEYAMADVAAKLGTSIGDIVELSETARRVGVEYGIGAKEAAKGLVALAAAGFDAAESAVALESATMLAIIAGISMDQATILLVRSLSVFGAGADEATKYVDALVAADLASTAAASDLALALGYAGASAKSMGIDAYDALTAIAILSDRIGGAAKAGRSLDALFRELRTNSESLGIEIYKTDGSLRDFGEIIAAVTAEMEGMTVQEKNAWLTMIGFTTYAQRALLYLADLGDTSEETAEMWAEMNEVVRETGRATEAVATKMDTLTGSINRFNAAMEALKIAVAEDWAPGLGDVIDKLTKFTQRRTWFIRHPMPWKKEELEAWGKAYDEFMESLEKTDTVADDAGDAINDLADSIDDLADGIGEDIAQPIKTAVDEINRLIREGLLGKAQEKFADFAACATDKAGQMALSIQDDIWDLVVSTEEGYARLLAMAEEMPEGPARRAAIERAEAYRAAGYERIEDLEGILATLLTGGTIPTAAMYPDIPMQGGDVIIDMDINMFGIDPDAIDFDAMSRRISEELLHKLIDAGVIADH